MRAPRSEASSFGTAGTARSARLADTAADRPRPSAGRLTVKGFPQTAFCFVLPTALGGGMTGCQGGRGGGCGVGEVKQKVGVQKASLVLKRSRARAVIHIRRFKRFEQAETAKYECFETCYVFFKPVTGQHYVQYPPFPLSSPSHSVRPKSARPAPGCLSHRISAEFMEDVNCSENLSTRILHGRHCHSGGGEWVEGGWKRGKGERRRGKGGWRRGNGGRETADVEGNRHCPILKPHT